MAHDRITGSLVALITPVNDDGPLREPLRALEGEPLQAGIDIVRELGLDAHYGFSVQDTATGPRRLRKR